MLARRHIPVAQIGGHGRSWQLCLLNFITKSEGYTLDVDATSEVFIGDLSLA